MTTQKTRQLEIKLKATKELIEYLSETEKKNDKNLVDIEKVKQLIKDGADVNFFGKKEEEEENEGLNKDGAPIHYAAKIGNLELMKLLINNNADIYKETDFDKGWITRPSKCFIDRTYLSNPLMIAIESGHSDVVKLLLEKDVNMQSLLYVPYQDSKIEILKLLCGDKRISRDIKKRAFLSASETGQIEVLRFLKDEIKPTREENIEAFCKAAEIDNNSDNLNFFLNEGIDVNATNSKGKTALYYSLMKNRNIGNINLLFEKGGRLDLIDKKNIQQMIFHTIGSGHDETLDFLVKNDKDRYIDDNIWLTGLCYTALYQNSLCLKHIFPKIEKYIDINKNIDAHPYLESKDASNVLHYAARRLSVCLNLKNMASINYLIGKGANINSQDKDGNTPAHIIAKSTRFEIFRQALLDLGADFTIKNEKGETVDEVYKNAKKKGFYGYYPSAPTGTYIPSTPSNNNQNNKGNDQSESMNPLIVSSIDKTLIVGLSSYVKDALPAAISTSWNRLSTLTQPLTDVELYITNSITKAIGASSSLRSSASNFIQTSFRAAAPIAVMVAAAQGVAKFVGSYSNGKTIIDSSINASYEAAASLGQSGAAAIGGALCAGVATSVGIAGAASIALPIVGAFTAAYAAGKASDYIKSSIVR